MKTTLVLTRKPDQIFQNPLFPSQYGRFGTMIVLQGAKVSKVTISPGGSGISVPTGVLNITSEDGGVEEIKRFTTIERMHGYIQLKPQEHNGKVYKTVPYGLRYETGN